MRRSDEHQSLNNKLNNLAIPNRQHLSDVSTTFMSHQYQKDTPFIVSSKLSREGTLSQQRRTMGSNYDSQTQGKPSTGKASVNT